MNKHRSNSELKAFGLLETGPLDHVATFEKVSVGMWVFTIQAGWRKVIEVKPVEGGPGYFLVEAGNIFRNAYNDFGLNLTSDKYPSAFLIDIFEGTSPPEPEIDWSKVPVAGDGLAEALQIGIKWMEWWLDNNECDCDEYGHHCGKDQRRRELEQMKAALTPTTSSAGWLPIETAPRGELICIWIVGTNKSGQVWGHDEFWAYCYYDEICGEWRTTRPSGHLRRVPKRFVTHWMPLPSPPPKGDAVSGSLTENKDE